MINSKEYDNLYSDLLDVFASKKRVDPKKKYSLMYPVVGKKFNETGLMICGRSINGWYDGWTIPQLSKKKDTIIKNSKADSKNNWPVDEVDSMSKSKAFFKLTRKLLLEHYSVNPKLYTHYFTWTNLMKVAPEKKDAKITNHEFDIQVDICTKIFKSELDHLKPRNVVLMSGAITEINNWAYNFLEELGQENPKTKISKSLVVDTYDYNGTRIISTIRPEALPKGGTIDDLFSAIVEKLQ